MIDYSQYETTSAVPEASSMIETFRSIGYDIEAAIADIIDNSIPVNAKNIWVNFEWKGADTWLSIMDDGWGMNNEELIQALRPGSRNPLDDRNEKDLGRFGMGLKTASFSQCRQLSVVSLKENEQSVFWTWDLNFVNKTKAWSLLKYLPDEKRICEKICQNKSGTIVIWNDIDRLVKNFNIDDERALNKFLQTMEQVKKHLAMVFHRYIETGKIKIHFQDRLIEAWNPFLINQQATQPFPNEPLQNGRVICKGYVLPHKSKITDKLYKEAEGPKGWNEQQGFYIYREERLLLAGDWLGMFRKEEHYKLARIQIDLPNNLDEEWQIDIKKSVARPPMAVRDQLRAYAGKVRSQAVEVYRHKGRTVRQIPGQTFMPLWVEHKRGDKYFYKINRTHTLIEKIKKLAESDSEKAIETLIRFIEETIPTKSIYIKESEQSETIGKPFEGVNHNEIRKLMKQVYDSLIEQGKNVQEAKAYILNLEPFNHYPEYIDIL